MSQTARVHSSLVTFEIPTYQQCACPDRDFIGRLKM